MQTQKKKVGIKQYLANYKWAISAYIITTVLGSVLSIILTLSLAQALEAFTNKEYLSSIYTFLFVLAITFIRRGIWTISNVIYFKYSTAIMSDLNLDLAKQAFKLNSQTYADHDTGTFVQRIVNDPERLVNNLANIVNTISDIISATVVIVYICTLSIYIGAIFLVLLGICFVIEFYRIKIYKKNNKKARKLGDKINSLTTEIVRSEKDIKAIGLEDKLSEVSKEQYNNYRKINYKRNMIDTAFWTTRNLLIESISIVILILGIVLVSKEMLTIATFMIVYSNSNELYGLVWQVGNITTRIADIKISSGRMFALFENEEFVCENFGNVELTNVAGKIEFKNVSYAYNEYEKPSSEHGEEDDTIKKEKVKNKNKNKKRKIVSKNVVFEDLNFEIEPNSTVAFVGKSGSGKSTILSLMSKMYEVDGGEVLIDGVNINSLNKQTLRQSISLVNQFPYIFDMTIKENLLLAKIDATNAEIENAIKEASFDDFVSTLKNGINTQVGESGVKLSGGQKQRLAIARALLRKSSIIIFDESTSSLDNFAQENIKKSIDNLKGKSTVVIVAHRLSTIKNVDKIFFLDEGKIIDSGTFDYLFENNEKFKNMFLAENI